MAVQCECGFSNADGAYFCESCGQPLTEDSALHVAVRACKVCGAPNMPAADKCAQCGAALPIVIFREKSEAKRGAKSRNRSAKLIVTEDNSIYELSAEKEIIIGRTDTQSQSYPDLDLTLHHGDDGGVSRIHARVWRESGEYYIEDQRSTNNTYVNNQRLEPFHPTALRNGDIIRLGKVELIFEYIEPAAP